MEFRDSPEDAAFRQEVRDFIRRELPPVPRPPDVEALNLGLDEGPWIKDIHRKLAPLPVGNFLGLGVAGPAIIQFGTEEQKREHLRGMTSGEVIWCQGFSEAGSGSDLSSLQTRAVRGGGGY